jgi:hypothetical protein
MNKMIKNILVAAFILLNFPSFSAGYKNHFWNSDYHNYVRISNENFRPKKVIINLSTPFDAVKGIYFGVFYESSVELMLTKYLDLGFKTSHGPNIPYLKTIDAGFSFRPLSFLKFYFDYRYRDFSKYKIGENNILVNTEAILNTMKYFYISQFFGVNMRFVDLDIRDTGTVYKRDWLFASFFIWKFYFLFNPVYLYSFGFSIGNIDEYEIFSINYWQIDIVNYFHLPAGFSIYVDGGFGFAGSFVIAGMLNRFWVRLGFRYEIDIH